MWEKSFTLRKLFITHFRNTFIFRIRYCNYKHYKLQIAICPKNVYQQPPRALKCIDNVLISQGDIFFKTRKKRQGRY